MGVTRVTEQFERRRSSFRDGKIIHIRAFLVTTDDVDDGTAVALTAVDPTDGTSVPAPGEWLVRTADLIDDPDHAGQKIPNPSKIYPRVTGIDADVWQNDSNHFQVLCEYTVPDPNDPPDNPLDRPVELSYTYNEGTEQVFIDKSDPPKPYVNSSGDAFEEFYERETGELVIQLVRNVATFDPVANDNYKNTINDGAIVIDGVTYAAGTCKLSPITATKQTEKINVNGIPATVVYYRRTMTIKARHEGWNHLVQDVGFNEKVTVTSLFTNGPVVQLKPILDSIGVQVKKPWPLNGSGKAKPNANDTPETLTFKPYTRMSWSGLTFN